MLLLEAEACGNGHHPAVLAHYCSWPVQCRHEETGVSKMAAVCVRADCIIYAAVLHFVAQWFAMVLTTSAHIDLVWGFFFRKL